jgi:hypothetical protein
LLKKLLTISIAFLYLAMTAGMVVSAHYCMGDLADVSLGHDTAEKCSDCGMNNNGCCHDDVKVFRITDAHGPASGLAINKISDVQAILPSSVSSVACARFQPALTPVSIPDPPDPDGTSICILHSVFRI